MPSSTSQLEGREDPPRSGTVTICGVEIPRRYFENVEADPEEAGFWDAVYAIGLSDDFEEESGPGRHEGEGSNRV